VQRQIDDGMASPSMGCNDTTLPGWLTVAEVLAAPRAVDAFLDRPGQAAAATLASLPDRQTH
jgi:hypothetical protein